MTTALPARVAAFQFTRPRGARRGSTTRPAIDESFNSRAHAGRDYAPRVGAVGGAVSIHAPTRGATGTPWLSGSIHRRFNSRAHAGRDARWLQEGTGTGGFNSRAHAGRDYYTPSITDCKWVSIHAPTRGATCAALPVVPLPAFQFTRPRGARRVHGLGRRASGPVSIHAPTRGATSHTS